MKYRKYRCLVYHEWFWMIHEMGWKYTARWIYATIYDFITGVFRLPRPVFRRMFRILWNEIEVASLKFSGPYDKHTDCYVETLDRNRK